MSQGSSWVHVPFKPRVKLPVSCSEPAWPQDKQLPDECVTVGTTQLVGVDVPLVMV